MPPPDLTVRNLQVSHGQVLDASDKPVLGKKVSFSVGTHGPFYLTYSDPNTPVTRIKSDIQAQVAELASLHEMESI
jgi:hypothetical protein